MGEPKGNIEAALPKRPPDGLPDIGVLPDFLDEGSIPHKNSFFYPNRQAESLKHLCTHQFSHLPNVVDGLNICVLEVSEKSSNFETAPALIRSRMSLSSQKTHTLHYVQSCASFFCFPLKLDCRSNTLAAAVQRLGRGELVGPGGR